MEIILQIVTLSENTLHVTNWAEADICKQSQSNNLHVKYRISKLPVTWHKVYDINEYIMIRWNTIPIKQTAHPGFSLKLEEVHDFRYMKK